MNSLMESQTIHIKYRDKAESLYQIKETGQIEIHQISEDLQILKMFFPDLVLKWTTSTGSVEELTQIMLSNYPVDVNDLNELVGLEIKIVDGWPGENMFTMLSIWDGEKIDNNLITISKENPNKFRIKWKGNSTDKLGKFESLQLSAIASTAKDVVTPLCMNDKELIELSK